MDNPLLRIKRRLLSFPEHVILSNDFIEKVRLRESFWNYSMKS